MITANPIQPNTQSTQIPVDAFPGQKIERSQDTPLIVVDRKQDTPSAREEIPREQVEQVIDKLNRLMGIIDKRLKFTIKKKSPSVNVEMIDQSTGEVLNEIPSQKAIKILESFSDLIGLMVDKNS